MIVSSTEVFEINKIYEKSFCENTPMNLYSTSNLRFFVLRKATKEEYIEWCLSRGCRENAIEHAPFYYEISVD